MVSERSNPIKKLVVRIRRENAARDGRPFRHAIAVVAIVLISFLLFYKHLFARGPLMWVDMTFPTTIGRNMSLYVNTWWQYGSVQNIWNIQRVFWAYPLLFVSKALFLSTAQYLLVLFSGTFALAGIAMYALTYHVVRSCGVGQKSRYAIFIGSVLAAVVFMYNPWSLSHLWPYFGYPGYAVLPLVFLLLAKTVDSPKPVLIVALAVLISIASTGPICVVWFWFLIILYLLFHILVNRFSRESLLTAFKILIPVAILYAFLNAVWILPYMSSVFAQKPFVPSYVPSFSQKILDALSANNTLFNNIRLSSGWGMPIDPNSIGRFWVFLSMSVPVLAVSSLVLVRKKTRRNRYVDFWAVLFLLAVILATGTHFILRKPYSYFTLNGPGASTFGWMFRAPDRWLVFVPVFYAMLIGLLLTRLLENRTVVKGALAVGMIVLITLSLAPLSLKYANLVYGPTPVPKDYAQVNKYISEKADESRVVWLPFSRDGFHYSWAPDKRIGAFNVYSSNPNLNNLQDLFSANSFYYWLESMFATTQFGPLDVLNRHVILSRDLASRLFMPFSADYMIFDSSVPGYRFSDTFKTDTSMHSVFKTNNLEVFKLSDGAGFLRAANRIVAIDSYYDELAVAQKLSPDNLKRIAFVDHQQRIDEKYGVLDMRKYKDGYDINSGFEDTGANGLPAGWTLEPNSGSFVTSALQQQGLVPGKGSLPRTNAQVSLSVDTRTKSSGKQSLRVENRPTEDLAVDLIAGSEIPVTQGDIYSVETSIKYRNANWTHVTVEGYEVKTGKWIALANCPIIQSGTSGWKKSECSFYMPAGISEIRPTLVAGWAADSVKGPAVSWFDDIRVSRINDRFYSDLLGGPTPPQVSYRKVSPEKYEVQVHGATEPFMLIFGEAYDPMWRAGYEDGKTADPVKLYSVINGVPVSRKGNFKIAMEYMPQTWFVEGLVVSLVALLACLLSLVFVFLCRRRRRTS